MSPLPQHGTPAGDATLAIRRLARQTHADVQELQTLYVLEALLARLAVSPYRGDFVLKGGLLLAAFAVRRPTKDIDLQATGISNDVDEVMTRMQEIAGRDLPDGVVFDTESVSASVIRADDDYAGVRVKVVGALGRSRLGIGIDVNFGDPIWPPPTSTDLPRVVDVGLGPVNVLGYPMAMVLGEKIVTAIERSEANTRWRDYADIYTLIKTHEVDADELAASLTVVASYRHLELQPLLPALARMPEIAQAKWRPWRVRVHREEELPELFAEVLQCVAGFADPVITGGTAGKRWEAAHQQWS